MSPVRCLRQTPRKRNRIRRSTPVRGDIPSSVGTTRRPSVRSRRYSPYCTVTARTGICGRGCLGLLRRASRHLDADRERAMGILGAASHDRCRALRPLGFCELLGPFASWSSKLANCPWCQFCVIRAYESSRGRCIGERPAACENRGFTIARQSTLRLRSSVDIWSGLRRPSSRFLHGAFYDTWVGLCKRRSRPDVNDALCREKGAHVDQPKLIHS